MTTAKATTLAGHRTTTVGSIVRASVVATLAAGLAAGAAAAVLSDSSAAAGAGIGAVMVCAFFGFGALVLDVVTRLAPAVSLLVALLTYTLQVVLVGLVFVALSRAGALDGPIDADWLGGTVIACTLVWLASQILFSVLARQPLYDLPSHTGEANVR